MIQKDDLKWRWLVIPSTFIGVCLGLTVALFDGPTWAAIGFGANAWYVAFFTTGILQALDT